MDKLERAILKGEFQLFTLKDLRKLRENATKAGKNLQVILKRNRCH